MRNPRTSVRAFFPAAAVAVVVALTPTPVAAQVGEADWAVSVAAFVWLSNIDGSSSAGGTPVAVVDSSLRAMPAVRVEVARGRVGFVGEAQRASTAGSDEIAGVRDWTLDITHLEIGTQLRLGGGNGEARVDVIAGLRYVRHDLALEGAPDAPRDAGADWLEPFGGVRFANRLGGPFRFRARGNIGGLGIGSSFTWVVEAELAIRARPWLDVLARYRYSEAEFASGGRLYVWDDGQVQGWYIGLGVAP